MAGDLDRRVTQTQDANIMEQLIGIGAFFLMTFIQAAVVFCLVAAHRAAASRKDPRFSTGDTTTFIKR